MLSLPVDGAMGYLTVPQAAPRVLHVRGVRWGRILEDPTCAGRLIRTATTLFFLCAEVAASVAAA